MIPPCFVYQQYLLSIAIQLAVNLVVISNEQIYVVRAASARGKIIVK